MLTCDELLCFIAPSTCFGKFYPQTTKLFDSKMLGEQALYCHSGEGTVREPGLEADVTGSVLSSVYLRACGFFNLKMWTKGVEEMAQ